MRDHQDSREQGNRKRSRSPRDEGRRRGAKHHRSRSPQDRSRTHRHSEHDKTRPLPYHAKPLNKYDFKPYYQLFAEYLDIQKGLDIRDLDEHEVKGRWKSFLGKWNHNLLAEGWYEPARAENAASRSSDATPEQTTRKHQPTAQPSLRRGHSANSTAISVAKSGSTQSDEDEDDDQDDDIGPAPLRNSSTAVGPVVPTLQDLQYRGELVKEDREARLADVRYERKLERKAQKERMEDLVPRAEPGTRERQLEKKREAAASNRTFAASKEAGDVEVGDKDLMGGDDGVDEYKRKLKLREKAKTEREIKKEEVLRAREAEREEKLRGMREKEERTMAGLRELAKARFG